MSAQAGSAVPSQKENTNTSDSIADKGKGKATQDVSMGDDESSSEEELDEVGHLHFRPTQCCWLTTFLDC